MDSQSKLDTSTFIEDTAKKCEKSFVKARILIAGGTATGKSALTNRIFHKNRSQVQVSSILPAEANIDVPLEDEKNVIPILLHDSRGAEKGSAEEYNKTMKRFLKKRGPSQPVTERIHCAWYLIALNGRLEKHDIYCFRELFKGVPLAIVLTKLDEVTEKRENDFYTEVMKVKLPDQKVFCIYNSQTEGFSHFKKEPRLSCYCKGDHSFDSGKKTFMCDVCHTQSTGRARNQINDLIAFSLKMVPIEAIPSVVKSLPEKKRIWGSIAIISSFSVVAAGLGFSPIPFSDIILIIPVQTAMCCALSYAWGFPPWKGNGVLTTVLSSWLLQAGVTSAGLLASNILKFIPFLGTLVAGISNSIIGGTLTVCMGISYVLILSKLRTKLLRSNAKDLQIPKEEFASMLQEYLDTSFIKKIFEGVKLTNFRETAKLEQNISDVLEANNYRSAISPHDSVESNHSNSLSIPTDTISLPHTALTTVASSVEKGSLCVYDNSKRKNENNFKKKEIEIRL